MEYLFFLIGLVPLVFGPRITFNAFGLPQLLALSLLSTLGIILGVGQGIFPVSAPSFIILVFLGYMVLVLLWTSPIHNGRKEFGLQVTFLATFLLGCAFLTKEIVLLMCIGFTITVAVNIIYSILQTKGIDPLFPNTIKRGGNIRSAIGTIGNSNYLSSFLCSTFWLVFFVALQVHWIILSVGVGIIYIVFLKSKSRAGQLGILGSLWFFILVNAYFQNWQTILNLGIALTILGAIFAGTVLHLNWDKFWRSKIDPKGPQIWFATLRYRFCYWWSAWEMIKENPIFGGGFWYYRKNVYRYQAKINDKHPNYLDKDRYITPQPRECHNDFLEHLVEFGAIGFCLFIAFLFMVFWMGFGFLSTQWGTIDGQLMLVLLTSLVAILINSFFFFALRITSSGLVFWVTSASIVVLSGGAKISFIPTPFIMGFTILLVLTFLYKVIWPRVVTSFWFGKSLREKDWVKRNKYLTKALIESPDETLLRTHACINLMDNDPVMAAVHCSKMLCHYDGQTPLAVTMFNIALARLRNELPFEEAEFYLKYSHWLAPWFTPSRDLLTNPDGVGVRSKVRDSRRAKMRIADEKVKWQIQALMAEVKRMEGILEENKLKGLEEENTRLKTDLLKAKIQNVLLHEKKRLNVPDTWQYNTDLGQFLHPMEIEGLKEGTPK